MRAKHAFMRQHLKQFRLTAMCRVLGVNRSGYYAWAGNPDRPLRRKDDRLRGLIKHAWLESGTIYGYRKITRDLRESGERCSRHRVRRLMKAEGIRAEIGYGRKLQHRGGPPGVVDNLINRDFSPSGPNKVWAPTSPTSARMKAGCSWQLSSISIHGSSWLGDAVPDDHRPCLAATCFGDMEAEACCRLDHSLRSTQSVH